MGKTPKQTVQKLLNYAGIKINGNKPYDIQVKDERLYQRILTQGSLGLGEAYMDGGCECKRLDEFFTRILKVSLNKKIMGFKTLGLFLKAGFLNMQTISRASVVGKKHYDVGNDFDKKMRDKRMVYSCGYWRKAKNLDQAQEAKLDLICKKLNLKKGQKILDIGCGWGSFAKYAAEKYKVRVVGITISKNQSKLARELCK